MILFLEQYLAKIQNSCNLKFLKAAKISCVNFIYRTSKAAKYKKTGLKLLYISYVRVLKS